MTDRVAIRTFPTAFKLAAIKRLAAGAAVLPLARELGVSRKLLHDWRKAWDLHGPAGLNRKRGPKPGPRKLRPLTELAARGSSSGELAQARVKIAELERKIGQQAIDIDFFHKALRALDAADQQGSIVPASRKSSKP
jgi:transposase-like protein